MNRKLFIPIIGLAMMVAATVPAQAESWNLQGDVAESCSCNPACPCMFGSPSTNEHCEGSRLVEIHKGHYGDVNLDGVRVVMTFRMGGWVKFYIDGNGGNGQIEAARDLMHAAFPSFASWPTVSTEQASIAVDRSETMVKFSAPASTVEIEVMKGTGGLPVEVHHLASADNYVQYTSVKNEHHSDKQNFTYKGTNGFTATVDAGGGI